LLARDARRIVDVVENRWLDEEAAVEVAARRAAAADSDLRFVLADLLILPYAVELVAADDRAHFRVAVHARSDLDRPGLVDHGVDEFPVDRPLHQNPAAGGTDFALVDEHAEERAVDRRLEIG